MCHCYGIDMAIDRTETAAMAVVLICNDRLPGARSDIGRTWINELDYICRATVYTDVTSIAKTPIYKFNHLDASLLDFRLIRHQTYSLAGFDKTLLSERQPISKIRVHVNMFFPQAAASFPFPAMQISSQRYFSGGFGELLFACICKGHMLLAKFWLHGGDGWVATIF